MGDGSTDPKRTQGVKKPRVSLVPPALTIYAAKAFEDGAAKYGPYNWRKTSVQADIYVEAALRHLMSWWDGEEVAPDSGVHHLGHAAACIAILLDAQACDALVDNRPPSGPAGALIQELTLKGAS